MARERPDVVRKFLRAVIAGWDLTYADEAANIQRVARYVPARMTPERIRFVLQRQRNVLRPLGARFGEFDTSHWRLLQDMRLSRSEWNFQERYIFDFLRDVYRESESLAQSQAKLRP